MRVHLVKVGLLFGSLVPLVMTGIIIRENVIFRKNKEIYRQHEVGGRWQLLKILIVMTKSFVS